ncbi:LuxR family transcriptional regulator [Chryseobacterium sp. OSA05B]|uniref:LuxR family transcriptional regulator n=1 Tax=Chryseobacterium sp. OSA05B TaxID=2862650 RepID=UPI001CBD99C6|nr:LuxR family transcriptional regulator [Chryseobacterium sp. OSA05B]
MKIVVFIFISFFSLLLINSCRSEDDNEYFYNLNDYVSAEYSNYNLTNIRAQYDKELAKYKKTGDKKYLLSSKYVELFLYYNTDSQYALKQIPLLYELLKLNNDQYEYISISCNFMLALHFEHNSPKFAMYFLDEAIKTDEKIGKKYILPHLYHAKGRLYYNEKNYSAAMLYFNKALKTYIKRKDDKIFIASMHNNFGMCFNQLNKTDKAIQQTLEGIKILEGKKKLNKEDLLFITAMKVNLGKYYLKQNDYKNSYIFWNEGFEFYQKIEQYNSDFMFVSQKLFDMYERVGQNDKKDSLARLLTEIEPKIQYLPDKITLYEILQNYYLEINDREKQKASSKKILHLITLYNEKNQKELAQVSDLLNDYFIKSINQKYDYNVNIQKKNNWLVLVSALLIITVLAGSFINVHKKNKKNKEFAEKQELTLNQDIQSQKNRIKNLQLSLNLKIEMEKAFLENLKQIKKTKNLNAEEVVKNLIFKINNLLEIDRKNNDIINESYTENKMFMEKLSERFPVLTDQELQLCIYFKLDLSSKEISLLENIKDVTARVYKANIKSKMKLDKETDLTLFLNSIK